MCFFSSDVDSSKLDLSKDLTHDFTNAFDSLIDPVDLQLTTDDFVNNQSNLLTYSLEFFFVILVAQCT